ncbi:MAG TPA: DegV family protein [Gammaproteobacteria bacterium]|jgi:DegV family protein with EDD domain|nr:DegV family protein [Gammaproteobacteria bacterium]
MTQKIGLVVDSTCDLPRSFIEQHGIEIMPINMHLGTMLRKDTRDPEETMDTYRRYVGQKDIEITTAPMSVKAIKDWFLDQLVLKYDRLLVITASSTRSATFENASKASFMILSSYKEIRKAAGLDEQFAMRVLDSKTMFTGLAVTLYEAARILKSQEDITFDKLRQHIENFSQNVKGYLVPQDLYFLRTRGSQKGDKSVGWLSYQMGGMLDMKPIIQAYRGETDAVAKVRGYENAVKKLFEMGAEAITAGLQTRVVCMSYGGNPEEVKNFPGYSEFMRVAQSNKVDVLLSIMSTSGGIHVGPGAFSMAYATK